MTSELSGGILPLNEMAREKNGVVLTNEGFLSLHSCLFAITPKGKVQKIGQGVLYRPTKAAHVILAPEDTVLNVLRSAFRRHPDSSYAVYKLVPPADIGWSDNLRRVAYALVGLMVVSCFSLASIEKYRELSLQSPSSIVGTRSYEGIQEILKDAEFLNDRKVLKDDLHTREFIERIRSFHSSKKEAAN